MEELRKDCGIKKKFLDLKRVSEDRCEALRIVLCNMQTAYDEVIKYRNLIDPSFWANLHLFGKDLPEAQRLEELKDKVYRTWFDKGTPLLRKVHFFKEENGYEQDTDQKGSKRKRS